MPDKATPVGCVFCGATDRKMSKEHVWPKWIRELVPDDVRAADHTYVFEDSERGEFRRVSKQPIFNLTVRGVCEPCNNDWMNRTEESAARYISGILQGRGRQLHKEGQTALARWGLLKGLVAQRSFRDMALVPIESGDYRALYELRDTDRLPDPFTVYTAKVGWSAGKAAPGFFRLNGVARSDREDRDKFDGYVIAFSVLDLVVLILRIAGDNRAEFLQFGHSPRLTETVAQIWPPSESFIWPPGPALTHKGLAALAGGDD